MRPVSADGAGLRPAPDLLERIRSSGIQQPGGDRCRPPPGWEASSLCVERVADGTLVIATLGDGHYFMVGQTVHAVVGRAAADGTVRQDVFELHGCWFHFDTWSVNGRRAGEAGPHAVHYSTAFNSAAAAAAYAAEMRAKWAVRTIYEVAK